MSKTIIKAIHTIKYTMRGIRQHSNSNESGVILEGLKHVRFMCQYITRIIYAWYN